MRKPNLFLVGAPKSGTTAWRTYLADHSEIFFSGPKEPHFFNFDHDRFRWYRDWDSYLELFPQSSKYAYEGECSVMYLYSDVAVQRLIEHNSSSRVLAFLRPPLSFLPSYHNELLYGQNEVYSSFAEAWVAWEERKFGRDIPKTCLESSFLNYAAVASFGEQVERLYRHVPREQVHIVWFDRWTTDARSEYLAILNFLDLQDGGRTEFPKIHAARSSRSKSIARITQRPGPIVLASARLLRRALKRDRLHLGRRLKAANMARASVEEIPRELAKTIAKKLEPDRRKLEQVTGRLLPNWLKMS